MKYTFYILVLLAFSNGCTQSSKNKVGSSTGVDSLQFQFDSRKADSIKIINLLKTVYEWRSKNAKVTDFDVEIEDTLQVGLNMRSHAATVSILSKTGFFSDSFLQNYNNLGALINTKLTTAVPRLQNEINFPFQDADSWTFFQDDEPGFWTSFAFTYFDLTANSCVLKWKPRYYPPDTPGYEVRFVKESNDWKISYLEGFDIEKYYK